MATNWRTWLLTCSGLRTGNDSSPHVLPTATTRLDHLFYDI